MAGTENKVKFGLNNVYYAPLTSDSAGTAVYSSPVRIPGAVNLTLDPEGEQTDFYADDMDYYSSAANDGYSGSLEVARLPDSFRKDVLKETEDSAAGVLIENVEAEPAQFALLFEFSGDKQKTRHVLYKCSATRPSVNGATITNSKEPTTETLNIKASPLSNGNVKAKTTSADGTAYTGWFEAVYQKA